MDNIIYGDDQTFDQLTKGDLVLVDFYANWCGPCKMLSPILEVIAKEHTNLKIVKIDVDTNQSLAMKYGVMSIPTLILFKDSEVVGQRLGFLPKDMLVEWIVQNKKN